MFSELVEIKRLGKLIYKKDTEAKCLRFWLYLSLVLENNLEAYYNSNHIIVKVGESYVDHKGTVTKDDTYLPVSDFGLQYFQEAFVSVVDPDDMILLDHIWIDTDK